MTRLISALAEVSADYDALFCDLWGCLHNGVKPFPAAVAALQAFRAQGKTVVLVTNSPRPAPFVAAQLDRMGVPRDCWDVIASSGDAAQEAMLSGAVGRKVWHLGPAKDEGFFSNIPDHLKDAPPIERVDLKSAEGIVCTGPFDEATETPEDYRSQFLYAKTKGLPMLCANPDIVVDMGDRRIFCAGALAEAYEEMGGTALYFGKPHPPIYDLARNRLTAHLGRVIPDSAILAIGDGINTDVQGGISEGIDTLFVTGGLSAEAFGPDPAKPREKLLREWLKFHQMVPTYAIGMLA